jgi:hypothetical protein
MPFESGDWQPTFESCFVEQFWQFATAVRGQADAGRMVKAREAAHCHELWLGGGEDAQRLRDGLFQRRHRTGLGAAQVLL